MLTVPLAKFSLELGVEHARQDKKDATSAVFCDHQEGIIIQQNSNHFRR
jgi:hypothetical protein